MYILEWYSCGRGIKQKTDTINLNWFNFVFSMQIWFFHTLLKTGGAAKMIASNQTKMRLRLDFATVHQRRAWIGYTITRNLNVYKFYVLLLLLAFILFYDNKNNNESIKKLVHVNNEKKNLLIKIMIKL